MNPNFIFVLVFYIFARENEVAIEGILPPCDRGTAV